MYFDQFGQVKPCCQGVGGLGHVTRQSLREIWDSARANRLREALAQRALPPGCGFCAWQAEKVGCSEFARGFDDQDPESLSPLWPVMMEFSMTNACNLQCVMCNGDLSSSIRAHREHRAPLPEVYGERFFEELEEFLPHLVEARFLGGEPLMGREPLRVLDMLAGLERPPRVTITTNGTQWSPRIASICERVPIHFVVSLDGITKETYESIRLGADFDVVMDNLRRFRDYARKHGTGVSLAHCLMRPNYHEFADLLVFAEEHGFDDVGVNTVLFPGHLSLFQMESAALEAVVDHLDRDGALRAGRLTRLLPVWDQQLDALRAQLRSVQSSRSDGFVDPWFDALLVPDPTPGDLDRWLSGDDHVVIRYANTIGQAPTDQVDRPIVGVGDAFEDVVGATRDSVIGQSITVMPDFLSRRFGTLVEGPTSEAGIGMSIQFEDGDGTGTAIELRFIDEEPFVKVIAAVRRGAGSMAERAVDPRRKGLRCDVEG